MMRWSSYLLIILSSMSGFCADVASPGGRSNVGSQSNIMSSPMLQGYRPEATVVSCLLEKGGVSAEQAKESGKAIAEALSKISFQRIEFNEVALIHFLTQGIAESAGGKHLTQIGNQPFDKKGFGFIQVTGPYNLMVAAKCMNKLQPPGLGNGVQTQPEMCIGNSGDPMKSMLASLCWWRNSIVEVNKHRKISLDLSEESAESIHEVVNAGCIDKPVTGGEAQIKARKEIFNNVKSGARECKLL